jgi:hypothetical protein
VHDDVGAVLEGAAEVRRWHRVVDDQRHPVAVRHFGQQLEVGDVAERVADRFAEDRLGFAVDHPFEACRLGCVGKAHVDAVLGQGVGEEVVGAAIERRSRDDVVSRFGDGHDRVGHRRLPRRQGEAGDAAFHCGDALFQDILGRIHDAGVDVAGHLEVEQVGAVLRTVEGIGRCLVDRHGDRPGRRFGTVTGVDGKGFKFHAGSPAGDMVQARQQLTSLPSAACGRGSGVRWTATAGRLRDSETRD